MIEARCVVCGKRYRFKGDPAAMDFLSLPCPQCGGMLEIGGQEEQVFEEEFLIEKPLALVFWDLAADEAAVARTLREMGYEVRSLKKASLLMQWLRFHSPSLILLGTEEEKRLALFVEVVNRLPMSERRQMFVVWVTSRFKSMDPREAFLRSLELIVNLEDLDRLAEVITRAKRMRDDFYRPFEETRRQIEGDL